MHRSDDTVKQEIARDIIDRFACVASTPVIDEVCNIFTRKDPVALEKLHKSSMRLSKPASWNLSLAKQPETPCD
ncbi:MAG: hypothetical protein LBS64_06240 [Spirochaetaceae bacterium]|jgi:predicted nucleic acid-binding protein|nr:hypothetical protein [Spirochaetaceae bacterium]